MANEQNKETQNTSFESNNQSTEANKQSSGFSNQSTESSKTNQSDFASTGSVNQTGSQNQTNSTSQSGTMENKTGSTDLSLDSAKETAKGFYDSAKSTAGQAFGAATKRATEVLDEQKGTVASGLTSVADSIKQVGENLNTTEESNKITETAAKYTNSLAQQIENLSGYFERKDVRDMVRDVEGFARRYPAYFIGGAVALGFLAARFLKSSSPKHSSQESGRTFTEGYDTGKRLTGGETTPGASQF